MRALRSITTLLSSALILSCGDGRPAGCDLYLLPTGTTDDTSVTEAAVALTMGQTLCFAPGTYRFTDEVTFSNVPGVTVRGAGTEPGDVILDFTMQTSGAKGLSFTGMDDLSIENLTVLDAAADNIFVTGSDGLVMRDLVSGWVSRPMNARGRYAIYPVQSQNVLVDNVTAYGSSDAGIYVGQATNCIVRNSLAYENVAGIEIENSVNCDVIDNTARDNTGGILVFELPGLPTRGMGTSVRRNTIENNNLPNFAEAGTIVSFLPSGTGIMLLAANDVELDANIVRGNGTTGALVVGYRTAVAAGASEPMDASYDGFTEDVWFHDNTFTNNGQMPATSVTAVTLILAAGMIRTLEDILWDGDLAMGDDDGTLCIQGMGTFRDIDLMSSFTMHSTDIMPHRCTGTARPPVNF